MIGLAESPFIENFPEESLNLLDGVSSQVFVNNLSEPKFRGLLERILSGGPDGNPRPLYEKTMIHTHLLPLMKAFRDMFDSGKTIEENFVLEAPMIAAELLSKHHKFENAIPRTQRLKGVYFQQIKERGNPDNLEWFKDIISMTKQEVLAEIDLARYLSENDIEVEIFQLTKRDLKICTFLSFLNQKGFDNILDKNPDNIPTYTRQIVDELSESPTERETQILNLVSHNISLHIKGAYKSMMGGMLEDPVLFSAFSACGLTYETRGEPPAGTNSFALDTPRQGNFKRQADALIKLQDDTILYVDIGFIGPGNPEIPSDKQSRFSSAGRDSIIIISRLPEKGKVSEIAKKRRAKVIQMCEENWVDEILEHLKSKGYTGQESIGVILPETDEVLNAMKDGVSRPESW